MTGAVGGEDRGREGLQYGLGLGMSVEQTKRAGVAQAGVDCLRVSGTKRSCQCLGCSTEMFLGLGGPSRRGEHPSESAPDPVGGRVPSGGNTGPRRVDVAQLCHRLVEPAELQKRVADVVSGDQRARMVGAQRLPFQAESRLELVEGLLDLTEFEQQVRQFVAGDERGGRGVAQRVRHVGEQLLRELTAPDTSG